nr:MAG: replication associated protein [Cressdnaviricota sp.]
MELSEQQTEGKYWLFTLFTTSILEIHAKAIWDAIGAEYLVLQGEITKDNNLHFQGYCEFKSNRKLNRMKKLFMAFGQAHFTYRNGTAEQNRHYCMKPWPNCNCDKCSVNPTRQSGPWEFGKISAPQQGKREDLLIAKRKLDTGCTLEELADDPECWSTFLKYPKGLLMYKGFKDKKRTRNPPKVTVLFGPSGTGKTHYVYERHPDLAKKLVGGDWFQGYDGEKTLFIDEFRGWMTWDLLLEVLDKYPVPLPTKGGHTYLMAEHIFVACNLHPSQWYDYTKFPLDALTRRVHEWLFFEERFKKPLVFTSYESFYLATNSYTINC